MRRQIIADTQRGLTARPGEQAANVNTATIRGD